MILIPTSWIACIQTRTLTHWQPAGRGHSVQPALDADVWLDSVLDPCRHPRPPH